MIRFKLLLVLLLAAISVNAQTLRLKKRPQNALSGTEFISSISDTSMTQEIREEKIFDQIRLGNVPDRLRKLARIADTANNNEIIYWVLPDYIAIGSNEDHFYTPMTPMLAQRVANLTRSNLPTRKIVNRIYTASDLKVEPLPIPPTPKMTTVPVSARHSEMVSDQIRQFSNYTLIAGNKKDIILSNKIYGEATARVVIYGWHKADGKPIQPLYNKHTNTWADYSHGVRLIQDRVLVNGTPASYKKILQNPDLAILLSDEGVIPKPFYPIN